MSKPPNILIIYPDQLRADAVGYVGNEVVKTPNINRLANEGTWFSSAYVATPMCTPFRGSLLTGKYAHEHGALSNHHPVRADNVSVAHVLREAGYATGYIGKWHLDGGDAPGFVAPGERRLGFEHFLGFNRGHYYLESIFYRDTPEPIHCERFEPDYQTDQLIDFMERSTEGPEPRPFFAVISYGPPHFPMEMPREYEELYDPAEVPVGPTVGDHALQDAVRRDLLENGFPVASGVWGMDAGGYEDEAFVREFVAKYYGLIASVDFNVGRILAWLDQKGLTEETVIVFLSDHGDMAGEHGHRCGTKKTAYKQSMHVPLIVRYPRKAVPGEVSELVDVSVDTAPTILELAGLEGPGGMRGVSYLSHLERTAGGAQVRDAVYYRVYREAEGPERFPVPERGIRTQEWLYVRTPTGPKLLIDLIADPEELDNLVDSVEHRGVILRLDEAVIAHMAEVGDDFGIEAVFPPAGFLSHEVKTEKQRELVATAQRGCGGS